MQRAEIERLLPSTYRLALDPPDEWGLAPDEALGALLDAMETMHQPIEDVLDHLETFVDPRRARASFLPYLCGWLDLDWLFGDRAADPERFARAPEETDADILPGGSGRLRELAAAAAELSRWRGTERGLLRFLETATGVPGFAITAARDETDEAVPFHIVIEVPAGAAPMRPLIERIVEEEKPAYVTHELRLVAMV